MEADDVMTYSSDFGAAPAELSLPYGVLPLAEDGESLVEAFVGWIDNLH
jgi:hypothetical protein